MGNMLTVGRALGVNNVSELQKLRRLVRSENTGRVQAHFEFNHEILDAFISSRLGQSRGVSLSSIFERFFPKSFSETAQTFIDVFLNKSCPGKNSKQGALTINTLTRNAEGVINTSETRVLSNEAGVIFNMSAKGEAGLKSDTFMHYSHYAQGEPSVRNILDAMEFQELRGVGTLKVNYKSPGKVKVLTSEVKAPVELFNEIAASEQYRSFSDLIASSNL